MRAACIDMKTRPALAVFDRVYAEPHSGLDEQREWFSSYLAGFDAEEVAR